MSPCCLLAIAAHQVTLCCASQESIFLLMIKSIEIWHRLVGTCLSYLSQFLPSWLAVGGGFITWLVSVTWWRWAFSRGLIEGADYDACRSFQQILTWKQWENNPTAHSSFFPYWLLHSPTLHRTEAHAQNMMHLEFTDTFTNIHTYTVCTQRCPETNHPNRWCLIRFSGYIQAPFAISTLVYMCVCVRERGSLIG